MTGMTEFSIDKSPSTKSKKKLTTQSFKKHS